MSRLNRAGELVLSLDSERHDLELRPDLSDLRVDFRVSPTQRMVELHAVYENGELRLPERLDLLGLKDARVKVVVRVLTEAFPNEACVDFTPLARG